MVGDEGFEPSISRSQTERINQALLISVVPPPWFEHGTYWLQISCSTKWAIGAKNGCGWWNRTTIWSLWDFWITVTLTRYKLAVPRRIELLLVAWQATVLTVILWDQFGGNSWSRTKYARGDRFTVCWSHQCFSVSICLVLSCRFRGLVLPSQSE